MSRELFQKTFQKKYDTMIIGHTGASFEAPGNTLRAFELAIDAGAEMIEFDIHKTIDDHIVVIHDRTTERTSEVNLDIHTSTLEEVRKVPMKDGLQIPTLDEVFNQFKGKLYFQIEIKQRGISHLVMKLIEKYGIHNQCVISSFIHSSLNYFKRSKEKLMLAYLEPTDLTKHFENTLRFWMVKNTARHRIDGYHPKYTLVTPELVNLAHSKGLFVNPWTADNPSDWEYLINCGVDGIITNRPRELCKFLESR